MRGLALGDDLSVLLKSLKHSDAEVRRSAAIALESFGAEAAAAVPVLTQALDDADVVTQVAVTRTLGQIGLAALPGLLQALGKPEKHVRREAIWALSHLGQSASDSVNLETCDDCTSVTLDRIGSALDKGAGLKSTLCVPVRPKNIGRTTIVRPA